jgi:hypothetical protein
MPGPATVLILAKKKAAGHGGYFDPMADMAGPAMGPMMFEMVAEETEETPMMASLKPDLSKMDFKSAAAKLREIADQLDQSSVKHAKQAAERGKSGRKMGVPDVYSRGGGVLLAQIRSDFASVACFIRDELLHEFLGRPIGKGVRYREIMPVGSE